MTRVAVIGLDELDKALGDVLESVAGGILADVMRDAGDAVVVPVAKQLAPVETGELRDSIEAVIDDKGRDKGIAKVVASEFYGFFHEFGTVHHAARPFMRPAFDQKRGEVIESARQALKKRVEGAAK